MPSKSKVIRVVMVVLISAATGGSVALQHHQAADVTGNPSDRAADVTRHDSEVCYAHLRKISAALMKYRNDHHGRLPRDLVPLATPAKVFLKDTETLFPRYIQSMDTLVCPTRAALNIVRQGRPTYAYCIRPWVRQLSFDDKSLSSHQFYNEIVPERGNNIRLVTCMLHPNDRTKRWFIMWDGSIQEQEYRYDPTYGRGGQLDRAVRQPEIRQQTTRPPETGGTLAEEQRVWFE